MTLSFNATTKLKEKVGTVLVDKKNRGATLFLTIVLLLLVGCKKNQVEPTPINWPPTVGQEYPDLRLLSPDGKESKLSSFRGKVILLELASMACPATVALSGGHQYGAFGSVEPQSELPSIKALFPDYADGTYIQNGEVVFIQLMIYDEKINSPALEELQKWGKHFHFDRQKSYYVFSTPSIPRNPQTILMIPGFHLIDKNFRLRYDVTKVPDQPKLYSELLPSLTSLLREKS